MIEAKNQDSRNKSGFQCINFFLFYDIANSFFLRSMVRLGGLTLFQSN